MSEKKRTTVIPIVKAPASWRDSIRFIKQLRKMFGDDKIIDIPEVHGDVVSFFADRRPDAVVVTAVEEVVRPEDDEHA